MQLKFPKKIIIGAMEFNIKYEKESYAGSFSYDDDEIIIGIKNYKEKPLYTLSVIIHELTEVLHCQMHTRFQPSDNLSNYLFSYSHKEHTKICQDLTGLLNNFIK